MPPNTVNVDRKTMYGNPFKVGRHPNYGWCAQGGGKFEIAHPQTKEAAQELVVKMFRSYITNRDVSALRGKNIACWCRIGQLCHGDVLLEIANAPDLG